MVHYYYNEDTKKTIAILNGCKHDAINSILKIIGNKGCKVFHKEYLERFYMPNQFMVLAKCSDEDEYDVETGKKIAKRSLMEKYYRELDKRIEMFKDELAVMTDTVFGVDRMRGNI